MVRAGGQKKGSEMSESNPWKPVHERIGEVGVTLLLISVVGKMAGVLQDEFGLKMFFVGFGLFLIFAVASFWIAVIKIIRRWR